MAGGPFHDIRSSLNGVICMGSLLKDTELNQEQKELLEYMLLSAGKSLDLINDLQKSGQAGSQAGMSGLSEKKGNAGYPVSGAAPEGTGNKPLSILLAEDDDIGRLYLTTLLKRQNWYVDEASDGLEALELFKRNSYQIVLMDVSMPGVDGIQASRQIREINSDIPILVITAHGEGELQEDFQEAGISDVLRKPIYDEFLLNKIQSLCLS